MRYEEKIALLALHGFSLYKAENPLDHNGGYYGVMRADMVGRMMGRLTGGEYAHWGTCINASDGEDWMFPWAPIPFDKNVMEQYEGFTDGAVLWLLGETDDAS